MNATTPRVGVQPALAAAGSGRGGSADILAIGFGTTVVMWFLGYLARIPPAVVPPAVLGVLMLASFVGGGVASARLAGRGWPGGAAAGLLAATLNLLVLGSLLSGDGVNTLRPGALVWLPGFLLLGTVLGALGAAVAGRFPGAPIERNWTFAFASVAAAATYLLIIVGGLVTSKQAGLAVTDWPNSFGYNMFLYPLSRMTGGIYYEHAHRLFGSLVGLTTVVLAVHLFRADRRRWVRALGLLAVLVVITQGILGGLRVTGRFTLSTDAADMAPSIVLAATHGVLGQLFFALVVGLAVFTSTRWRDARARRVGSAAFDRTLTLVLLGILVLQLALGAVQRHLAQGLIIHITLAVFVLGLAVLAGARAWGVHGEVPPLERLGRWLMGLVTAQVVLGFAALVALALRSAADEPAALDVLVRTAHQATGALLLACTVALALWARRLLEPEP